MKELQNFEEFYALKKLCEKLVQCPKDEETLKLIKNVISQCPPSFIAVANVQVLSALYPILKQVSEDKASFPTNHKQLIVDTFNELLRKFKLKHKGIFFNIYSFLLFEIYDHKAHRVLPVSEEYKLCIMECMVSLANSISSDLVFELYTKENAPKFCQMLYVALEIAKQEQLRSLRVKSIECILSIAKVLDDEDFNDVVVRNQVAEVFLYFIPGIASGLKSIATEDEKVGHKVPVAALKAWGRLVTLLMAHYGNPDEPFDLKNFKTTLNQNKLNNKSNTQKLKTEQDVKKYLESKTRSKTWYAESDGKMKLLVVEFFKLAHHSHFKVRLELVQMCNLVITNCYRNIPYTVSFLIEIIISMSEDENEEVKAVSNQALNSLSSKFTDAQFRTLLENLEEGFLGAINSLPRKFNGIDEKEQLSALNLIIGYINLFGKYKLQDILLSTIHLNKLLSTLIHISELEKNNVNLLEEYTTEDLEMTTDLRTPWKNFKKFKEDSIKNRIEHICYLLAKHGSLNIVSDYLLDIFMYDREMRKESTFLLNGLILGIENVEENHHIVRNIVSAYINKTFWNVPLHVHVDEYGYEYTLAEIQDNVILVCLLIEGIGKVALILKENFSEYMLKTLYLTFERAGSGNELIRTAGLAALKNIAVACKYSSLTDLLIKNIDYFTFYIERNLNKNFENQHVLDVLTVILRYSKIEVLSYISDIIKEVLFQSCDKYKEKNMTSYLRIFNIFIQSLIKWYDVKVTVLPIKSKAQREREEQEFYVSGVPEEEDFSDNIMKKSAEEMYKEDMKKKQEELEKEAIEDVEEYKKPEPPLHIKLTEQILARSLHFLPSKDRSRKLLVLQILTNGLEVIRDWEDELLPIVHQIWSPLVGRFKEFKDPLIINYSFSLLITLGRLSKEFIRMRTQNDVLPSILQVLKDLTKESYLKDKGSAYRYTQSYKLQVNLLQGLANLLVDLDSTEKHVNESMDVVFKYLSDKQPLPLQEASIQFYKLLWDYNPKPVDIKIEEWITQYQNTEFSKNLELLCKTCKILE